jgi:pyruvate,water dikinase
MDIKKLVCLLEEVGIEDIAKVGGKNASLGEMLRNLSTRGVKVPGGFVVTAEAFRFFLKESGIEGRLKELFFDLNTRNIKDLKRRGELARKLVVQAKLPTLLEEAISNEYAKLEKRYGKNTDVAVRSSATAEDLPDASFAGEHETFLGVRGKDDVIRAVKSAMASLFTDRAISYRADKGFDQLGVALSVAVQKMVRSDLGASGVMFSIDTESGFKDAVIINGSWGLGEMVVLGKVNPDEFMVFKKAINVAPNPIIYKKLGEKADRMIYSSDKKGIRPVKVIKNTPLERNRFVLSDEEVVQLASWAQIIEDYYSAKKGRWCPMDMEWAKDGQTGELFIVQARPETIHARRDFSKVKEYKRLEDGKVLAKGISVGSKIATGKAHLILSPKNMLDFKPGEILVTDMTDPDWEPIMKIASAIITDKGGRTSHAAIVSRELGIPAVVGCENATRKIKTGKIITVDTTGSDGVVMEGALRFEEKVYDVSRVPETKTKIMMNIATSETAFEKSFLPNDGVGLAREEFIIASEIGIHPNALINYSKLPASLKVKIDKKTSGWKDKKQFYIDNLSYGIARIGAAFHPKPVIVRFSDFKTNEYRALLGGELYEPQEENPMIGWRGASRYYDPRFKEAFLLEVAAIKKVREEMGVDNIIPMVPFCRTVEEGKKVLAVMAEGGLYSEYILRSMGKSLKGAVPVYVMCEIPSNIILARDFLEIFDGMSIGSNDLTQLTLGLDRDSGVLSHIGNELDKSVQTLVENIIQSCKARGKYIGICGQAPSDHKEFAMFLVQSGIDSMSLNPDSVIKTKIAVAEEEKKLGR